MILIHSNCHVACSNTLACGVLISISFPVNVNRIIIWCIMLSPQLISSQQVAAASDVVFLSLIQKKKKKKYFHHFSPETHNCQKKVTLI